MTKNQSNIEVSKIIDKAYALGVKDALKKTLPTDKECADWYDLNIDEDNATVSSSIYKFRVWLKERSLK